MIYSRKFEQKNQYLEGFFSGRTREKGGKGNKNKLACHEE